MIKVLRLTDLHLNFLSQEELDWFFHDFSKIKVDIVFLTGDIADGNSIKKVLQRFSEFTKTEIYYVLGNHDFHWSSFSKVYSEIKDLSPKLHLLDVSEPIYLDDLAIIGASGWFDAGWRKPLLPIVFIADWFAIEDFVKIYSYSAFLKEIDSLTQVYITSVQRKLKEVLTKVDRVCMLTHFPPTKIRRKSIFAKWWWDPYDSSKQMYEMIKKEMKKNPKKSLQVFAGHIHQNYQEQILPNVHLNIAEATLGDITKGQIFYL